MMIECKYYDISLARTEQMEKEIAEEKAALTEEEKLRQQKESDEGYKINFDKEGGYG